MAEKPTYEQLEQRVKELERKTVKRKQAEEALEESEDRFRSLFEYMNSGVAVYAAVGNGEDFVFKDFNRAGEEIDNVSREDIIGKRVTEVFPGVKDFGLFKVFQTVWRTGKPKHHPVTFYKDERISGWRDNFVYRLPSSEIVAIYSDETKPKQAEEALQEAYDELEQRVQERTTQLAEANEELKQEIVDRKQAEKQVLVANERLQYLLSSTTAVIYTAKTSGDYAATFITDNVAQMLGYEPREFVEKPSFWFERIHPEDKQGISVEVPRLFEQGLNSYEYRFRHKDDTYIWVRDEMKLVRDEAGNPLEIVGYWIDISDRKQAEEELRERGKKIEHQAQRLKKVNAALDVLLQHREEEKKEIEETIVTNTRKLIFPYVEKMEKSGLNSESRTCLRIIKSKLNDLVSPLARTLSSRHFALTPTEIRIADLVKLGKTSKEIASLLDVSSKAVSFHRNNIRKKLGLSNRKINLRSYLQSLSS